MTTVAVLLSILVIIVLWAITVYNKLILLRNQVKNAWGQIDVQLQRRYDLIPNLVETVKGYMNFERGTLEAVIKARSEAVAAKEALGKAGGPAESSLKPLMGAESTLTRAMGNFFALAENYPDLKANQTMQNLQEELSSTENKVAFSRQSYNDQVLKYNTSQQTFPANLVATSFGHKPADLFEVQNEQARQAVKVQF